MKILIVNHHPLDAVGGSEIQCDLIARHLVQLGHQVVYFAMNGRQEHYDASYTVERGTLERGRLRAALLKHQPDIVYWRFNRRKLLPSVLTCKRLHIPFVFSVAAGTDLMKWSHRSKFWERPFSHKVKRFYPFFQHICSTRLHYWGYYFVDGVIAQLEQQTGILPVKRQVVIHNSVDRTASPFHWEKPFVVWIGAFKQVKNPDLFLELARHFEDSGIDFLMMGKMMKEYEPLINSPDCPTNLHYLGIRPFQDVNGILRRSLFLVQTSDIEGFPNVMIQAWAQGKPTISLYYDPDNMIRENRLGFLSGSFERLITDTKILLENQTRRDHMGQRAEQFARIHFSPERNIPKFEAFFQKICRPKIPPIPCSDECDDER